MSWSVSSEGTREKVKEEVSAQFDRVFANYTGNPEGGDIKAVKERVLALVDELDLSVDSSGTDWNAVKVSAYGSHSTTGKGIASASFTLNVSRTHLAL